MESSLAVPGLSRCPGVLLGAQILLPESIRRVSPLRHKLLREQVPPNSAVLRVALLKDPWLWALTQKRPFPSPNSAAALLGLIASVQWWTRQRIPAPCLVSASYAPISSSPGFPECTPPLLLHPE